LFFLYEVAGVADRWTACIRERGRDPKERKRVKVEGREKEQPKLNWMIAQIHHDEGRG